MGKVQGHSNKPKVWPTLQLTTEKNKQIEKNNMPRSLIQEHKARLYYSNHKIMHLPLGILIVN